MSCYLFLPKIGDLSKNITIVIYSILFISFISNLCNSLPKYFSKLPNLFLSSNLLQFNETLFPEEFSVLWADLILVDGLHTIDIMIE